MLSNSPQAGRSVLYVADGRVVCRLATPKEALAMARRDPNLPLHFITPMQSKKQQNGLTILLRATQQLENFPLAKQAFIRAAETWQSLINTPVTLIIDVDFGPTRFGDPFEPGVLGSTDSQDIGGDAYQQVRTALIEGAGDAQERALFEALPQGQVPTDLGNTSNIFAPSALFRALGLINRTADPDVEGDQFGPPPSIGFNSNFPWDFNPDDGIDPDKQDFDGTAVHEIGHALGFTSNVGLTELSAEAPIALSLWDLYRFRPGAAASFSTARRILSSGGNHVFSLGASELPLSTGRPDASGGDERQASHWKDDELTGTYIGVMDPTEGQGFRTVITENDLVALDVMGYEVQAGGPGGETLVIDDGTYENSVGLPAGGTVFFINRLTPASYPATLTDVMIPFLSGSGVNVGDNLNVLVGANPSGAINIDNAQFQGTPATVTTLDDFSSYDVPDVTIDSGDFLVGFTMTTGPNVFPAALDQSSQQRRSYVSFDGLDFELIDDVEPSLAGNFGIRSRLGQPGPPPGGDTVPLTSGVPANGSIQDVNVLGTTQYTIEVPNGATQLQVDLNGNQDVDLFVRFGQRVTVEGGQVMADYGSQSFGGTESVTITPTSSPPLRQGTYFIAVANFGPGPASFTVTATVTGGGPPSGDTVPLTSGVPANGAIQDVNVLGATQYTIAVPIGASQLRVDLNGNQDVDLFVRFGQRVTVESGQVMADYGSQSLSGTESVIITPSSSPPLRQGTYFIAVANFGPGPASFTVTATVQ